MDDQLTFGPYRVLEPLASGPMARVYTAVHTVTGRRVLIRIVDPPVSRNKQIRAMLEDLRDPQGDRRIDDPAVLRILRVGTHGESFYVVHEHFHGVFLDKFLQDQRPTLREGLALAILITESLRAIHGRRIIHGDLKPQNILVARKQNNRLVVKIAMADMAQTTADAMVSVYGELMGTPKYMSPEQIEGKRLTRASDIFSLGILFYEMFSGREPFPADAVLGYLRANLGPPSEPLALVDTSVPADLSRVVARMLSKEPNQRYRRADSLLADLEHIETLLDGHAADAPPPPDSAFAAAPAPLPPRVGPWRAVAVAAIVMNVFLVATMLAILLEVIPLPVSRKPTPRPPAHTPSPSPPAVAEKPVPTPQPQPPPAPPLQPQPAAPTQKEDLAQGLAAARQSLNLGNPEKAIKQLAALKARLAHPSSQEAIAREMAAALFAQAESLRELGRMDEAIDLYKQVSHKHRRSRWSVPASENGARILLDIAERQKSRAEMADATATFEQIVRDFPGTESARTAMRRLPGVRARYGEALLPVNPDRAIELLRVSASAADDNEVADIRKKLAAALLERAEQRVRAGNFPEAAKDLGEVKTVDPQSLPTVREIEPELLYRHAVALNAQYEFDTALTSLQALRKRYPASKWWAKAMKDLAPLLRLAGPATPQNADILLAMAKKHLAGGDQNQARMELQIILKKHPDSKAAAEAAAQLSEWEMAEAMAHWQGGRLEQGRILLKAIADAYPAAPAGRLAARELQRYNAIPKGMVYVPEGEFIMGLDAAKIADVAKRFLMPPTVFEREVAPQKLGKKVRVAAFYIDRHEVTSARYKAFIDATNTAPPPSPAWRGREPRKGYEDYPVTNVTWPQATAYATWAGKRLPTEAEWEKAARGTDGRLFPWGDAAGPALAVTMANSPAPVGSIRQGRSPYGLDDMIGNVQEWTQDAYRPYGVKESSAAILSADNKVVRGAGWLERDAFSCLCTTRWAMPPEQQGATLGFRCAGDVK